MKKLVVTGLLLTSLLQSSGAHGAESIHFDFWNKTNQPLYFEIGTEKYPPMGRNMTLINASGAKNADLKSRLLKGIQYVAGQKLDVKTEGDFAQIKELDTSQKTLILLSRTKDHKLGDRAVLMTVSPGKDIFLRIKEDSKGVQLFANDNRKYIIGPQSGPLGGWTGYSERGLPLANNVKQGDITIDPNYIIKAKPLSPQEQKLIEATESAEETTSAQEREKLIGTLKALEDIDEVEEENSVG